MLRTQIAPKRQLVIRVSEDVQALNRSAFVKQQSGIAQVYGGTQRQLWEILGFALVSSFGVALWATLHASRLENRLRRQRATEVENARELQHLSAKLITAQEEERRSIARELHDEVGQVLTAIKVELAVAERSLLAGGGAADLLRDARSITEGALTTVRDLSHLLHPAMLDDLGLPAAIEWYLRSFGRRHGIRADVVHERMDQRLAPEIETAAYRIVQEALTNVAKHARATVCRVYLQRLPNTVLITIEDNGAGFDPASERPGERAGLGLVGIRERASQLRGTVRLESTPGKGTRLTVELPARSRPADAQSDEDGALRSAVPTPQPALPPMAKLRILLGDDHTLLRHGLRKILQERAEWEVVAEAGDGREAVRQTLALRPDVAILDIGMPLMNGIEATRQIVRRLPDLRSSS